MIQLRFLFSLNQKMVFEAVKFVSATKIREKHKFSPIVGDLYEDAVQALNNLQTNASVVQQSISRAHDLECNNIKETEKYLIRSGINYDDLKKLSIIHVSGTKGKGSTCALTESILRSYGLRTGFFSSPHLVSATERFRLSGRPISQEGFAKYFWQVYNLLDKHKENALDMPPYFKFLTVMAFHVFLEENVDVVIMEVGVGGEYDCTNVIKNTETVGITSLGLEHTALLGNTLSEIAWQKAGIIKESSNVFTVKQDKECMEMIQKRSDEKNAKLIIVPELESYKSKRPPKLDIDSKVQKLNASLAIQLSYDWLKKNKYMKESQSCMEISDQVLNGLEDCFWPGRCQLIVYDNKRIHLDGAHTIESIQICRTWFENSTKASKNLKCLIFNSTGDRNSVKMLKILNETLIFDLVIFVPNIGLLKNNSKDNINLTTTHNEQFERCKIHETAWKILQNSDTRRENRPYTLKVLPCVFDAFKFLESFKNKSEEIEILVTGSLHLVGATLVALEEFDKTKNTLALKN